jgi:hypothetical protein
MIHLAGFLESLDPAAAFVNIAALQDDRLFTNGDNLRVPALNRVIMAAGGAENTVAPRIRLTSPTLDEFTRWEITPLNVASAAGVEPGSPQAIQKMIENPVGLGIDENLRAELLSNPGAAQIQWALLWFSDGPPTPVVNQRMFTVRGTGATTVAVGAWTPATITLDDELPPGRYQIVGLRAESATGIAARIVNREGGQWRTGVLCADAISDLEDPIFRGGRMGVLAEFPFTQLPDIEFLCVAADTAQVVYFDLVRVGS